jgi:hypothetical protein
MTASCDRKFAERAKLKFMRMSSPLQYSLCSTVEQEHLGGTSVAFKSIETPARGRWLCVRNNDI